MANEEAKISSGIGSGILECSRLEFYRLISEQGYDNLFKQIYSWVFMGNKVMSAGRLLKQANQLKRKGKLDEAIALYHQAIEINPHFAWTYSELGDALVEHGRVDDASIAYQSAIDINRKSICFSAGLEKLILQRNERKLDPKNLPSFDTKKHHVIISGNRESRDYLFSSAFHGVGSGYGF
ncbi:MAG: tetratricopeptide repeat protein [Planktothrix sp. GU0601_MAG3]|nr:MAG: tetratricopeptide repeat protein [Planktothrix sp. GU0601_MAG3]